MVWLASQGNPPWSNQLWACESDALAGSETKTFYAGFHNNQHRRICFLYRNVILGILIIWVTFSWGILHFGLFEGQGLGPVGLQFLLLDLPGDHRMKHLPESGHELKLDPLLFLAAFSLVLHLHDGVVVDTGHGRGVGGG